MSSWRLKTKPFLDGRGAKRRLASRNAHRNPPEAIPREPAREQWDDANKTSCGSSPALSWDTSVTFKFQHHFCAKRSVEVITHSRSETWARARWVALHGPVP